MKVKDLTLAKWQEQLDAFRAANPSAPSAAGFRIDGTPFSTARFYGGMIYNYAHLPQAKRRRGQGQGLREVLQVKWRIRVEGGGAMKITVWIRPDAEGNATMRIDAKYEGRDTPRIQNFGRRLVKAMEGTGGEKE